jgi:hypothetical protein
MGFAASYMLLLDAASGTKLDSLSYTDPIVNGLLAHWDSREASWRVFSGTKHGSVRRYGVKNGHVRIEAERWIDHDWVWAWGFVGNGPESGIIMATADAASFIVDQDLNVLLKRSAEDGATISPLASFADSEGVPYVAFLCHGEDLCIDRVVPNSGWGTRSWYIVGYLLSVIALVGVKKTLV